MADFNSVLNRLKKLKDSTDIDEKVGSFARGLTNATMQGYRQPVNNFRNNVSATRNFVSNLNPNKPIADPIPRPQGFYRPTPYQTPIHLKLGANLQSGIQSLAGDPRTGAKGNPYQGPLKVFEPIERGQKAILRRTLDKGVQRAGDRPIAGRVQQASGEVLGPKQSLGRDATDILSMGATMSGLSSPLASAGYTAFGTVVRGLSNKLQGGKFTDNLASNINQSFVEGVPMAGIGKVTNPAIEKATGGLNFIPRIVTKGALNMGEGVLMDRAAGFETTKESLLIDALMPAGFELSGAASKQVAKAFKIGGDAGVKMFEDAIKNEKVNKDAIKPIKEYIRNRDDLGRFASKNATNVETKPVKEELRLMPDGSYRTFRDGKMATWYGEDKFKQLPDGSVVYKNPQNLMGGIAGVEVQRDEEGKPVGIKYDPVKGAIGVGAMAGYTKIKGNKQLSNQAENLIKQEVDRLKSQVGGVDIIKTGEDATGGGYRASSNPQWYKDFFAEYGRKLSDAQYRELAIKNLKTGEVDGMFDNPEVLNYNRNILNKPLDDIDRQINAKPITENDAKRLSKVDDNLLDTISRETPTFKLSAGNQPLLLGSGKLEANTPSEAKRLFKKYRQLPDLKFSVKGGSKPIRIKGSTPTSDYTSQVEGLKDISTIAKGLNDVYSNFKTVFGKAFPEVKQQVLDPFDKAKGDYIKMQKSLANELDTNIVKGLGIKPKSKDSALLQLYGEKKIDLETLKTRTDNWQNILKADKWFRAKYDELLDQVNNSRKQIYPNKPEKLIPRRDDYYRHFQEMEVGLGALKNIFERPSNISPELAGVSDVTKPKAKWLSIAQKRTGDLTDMDAVGGFINYAKQASYATHIDPKISNFRYLKNELVEATKNIDDPVSYAKVNNFIEFLEDYSNILSGKTNPADRVSQKYLGRKTFRALNWLNSRVKANVIVGNLSSTIAQYFNTPQGVAEAGLQNYAKGTGRALASIFNETEMLKSDFLNERYFKEWDKFDTGKLKDVKKFAVWITGVLDEVATKQMWSAFYEQAGTKGMTNKIKYADDMTRKMVSGRGVGEVPILQSAKSFQLIAPFQLEVANVWNIQKGWLDEKAFGKFITFALASYVLNRGAEKIRGSDVSFDPINAGLDAIDTYGEEDDKFIGTLKAGGRLAGEVVSNMPLGQTAAAVYPEYGFKVGGKQMPTRREFFGEGDPTRFGTGLIGGALKDPLFKVAPSYGGMQIKKTLQGIDTFRKGYNETQSGRVRFPVDKNIGNALRLGAFGQYSTPEAREYFDMKTTPLGEKQSQDFKSRLNDGSAGEFYNNIMSKRGANKEAKDYGSFYEMGKVGASDNFNLPTSTKDLSIVYNDVEKTINGYNDKKVKILYNPEYDQATKDTKLQELQDEMDTAIAFRKQIEAERPEQLFDIGIETYNKDGGQSSEDRGDWVAKQLQGVEDDNELQDKINKLYEGQVLTKSVVEYLNENYGLGLSKYNYGTGYRYLGGSGGSSKKIKLGTTPTFKAPKISPIKVSATKRAESKPIKLDLKGYSGTGKNTSPIKLGRSKSLDSAIIKLRNLSN